MDCEVVALLDIPDKIIDPPSISDLSIIIIIIIIIIMSTIFIVVFSSKPY